jgi:hypothetical protein
MSVSRTCLHRLGNVVYRHTIELLAHEAASGSARNLSDHVACRIIKRIVRISQLPGFVTGSDLPLGGRLQVHAATSVADILPAYLVG